MLVIAGAGTGKTKTLACRVAWLVANGVAPDRVLLLTFTRRAAAEMISRAEHLVGRSQGGGLGRIWGGTFHATANRLLRIYGPTIGLHPNFTVMDQGDAADLMNLIRTELGFSKKDKRFPRKDTLAAIYSRVVNARDRLADVIERHFPWCESDLEDIQAVFDLYTQRKRERNVVDYDDLLLLWDALCQAPRVGDLVANRFDHILVDEYQDTNAVQAEILRGMRRHIPHIMVVGDDAQSIYSFRAATVRNILDFPKQFPGTRTVTLEQNYRSTPPILAASNAVMAAARERYTKELWSDRPSGRRPVLITCMDEPEQCTVVCENILKHLEQGTPLCRQGVLSRAEQPSAGRGGGRARRKIPFHKYGGLKFIEAAHVKDMLAFLRILENPADEVSWFRVLQLIEGIGPKSARRIMDALGVGPRAAPGGEGAATSSPLQRLLEAPPPVPAAARDMFNELRSALADCLGSGTGRRAKVRRGPSTRPPAPPSPFQGEGRGEGDSAGARTNTAEDEMPLAAQIERLRMFYEPVFERVYDNASVRLRDIEMLEQIAAGFRSRGAFITDMTLDPPRSTSDLAGAPFLEEDYLILSTIHSAKGCEWDVVHILHAADGMIPSDMALGDDEGLEEERRLLYVAMTRAKDMLYVYFPLRYYHSRWSTGDRHSYAQLTRFIADTARHLFDEQPARTGRDADFPVRAGSAQDVQAWLKKLWRS